jgi:aspartyl-tRNA(Asn)/glutamyl-tRNA(Gln) amidotransferase subunit A
MRMTFTTVAESAAAIRSGELKSVDLVERCLITAARVEPAVHAFVTIDHEGAMRAAEKAGRELAAGHDRGPLHGIPIGLKDIIDTEGLRTTGMSRLFANRVPSRDAQIVLRLREAGAIILGKLSTHEFAVGAPDHHGPFAPARNPWDLERSPGGSSSGAGPAVATGAVLGAVGTDTGGSIRGPASLSGLVGLKPTAGLVGRSGIMPLSETVDSCGPMTWTVEDNAILLSAMAGYDPGDAQSVAIAPVDYRPSALRLDGQRIGLLRHIFETEVPCSVEVREALDAACELLRSLGAEVTECRIPSMWEMESCFSIIALAESFEVHREDLATRPDLYGESTRMRLALGAAISASDLLRAYRVRRKLIAATAASMNGLDALLTTGALHTAPRFGEPAGKYDTWEKRGTMSFVNLLGLPSLLVKTGFTKTGLPTAMQLIGHPFGEPLLYQIGHAYERQAGWSDRRPDLTALYATSP